MREWYFLHPQISVPQVIACILGVNLIDNLLHDLSPAAAGGLYVTITARMFRSSINFTLKEPFKFVFF